MPRIVVFGSLNMDLVVRASRFAQPGETITGSAFLTAPGGKGANQAVAARRLGADVAMIGRVGDDPFGQALRRGLAAEGLDVRLVDVTPSASTGVALITVDDSGENTIVVVPGANGLVSTEDIERALSVLTDADALLLQLEVPLPVVLSAARLARAASVPVILNAAPAQPLPSALLPLVDYLVVNETEVLDVAGLATDTPETASRALQARGARTIVVTLGAAGALLVSPDGTTTAADGFRVEAVDTTAAGDAFVGALAVALAEGATTSRSAALRQRGGRGDRHSRRRSAVTPDARGRGRPAGRASLSVALTASPSASTRKGEGRDYRWVGWAARSLRMRSEAWAVVEPALRSTMSAAASESRSINASPRSTPRSPTAVSRPSASTPCRATTVTVMSSSSPVRETGSMTWEYRRPSTSRCCSALPDVDTAPCVSHRIGGMVASPMSPSWIRMRQPGCAGGAVAEGDVAADGHERTPHACARDGGQCFARRVALADPPHVELHAGDVEGDRAARLVEPHVRVSGPSRRLLEGLRIRQAPGRARVAPEADDGTLRHIEGALGGRRESRRGLQDGEQVRADRERMADGLARHAAQLALREVVRQDAVQLPDAVEAGTERDARGIGIRGVHRDARQRAHVGLDALEPLERAGLGLPGGRRIRKVGAPL